MKNIIISIMSAYIFYGFCEENRISTSIIWFFLTLAIVMYCEEVGKSFARSWKRGKRLNGKINKAKGVKI